MEIFCSDNIEDGYVTLNEEESAHCVRVLRHREGESICVIDGAGNMYSGIITDASPKATTARIESVENGFGSHPYELTLAVCPTKNNDRYEWFVEKAVEVGVDRICPVIGERSERKVFKPERCRKIALSAAKQSLKGAVPPVEEAQSVKQFIASAPSDALKLIAYCFEGEQRRISMKEAIAAAWTETSEAALPKITVMIGPEGDFSQEEAQLAIQAGFLPIHLGPSRLRTETAAVTAAEIVYNQYCL